LQEYLFLQLPVGADSISALVFDESNAVVCLPDGVGVESEWADMESAPTASASGAI
jgi:hypothetical protein